MTRSKLRTWILDRAGHETGFKNYAISSLSVDYLSIMHANFTNKQNSDDERLPQ
jgi:hypothetical protein